MYDGGWQTVQLVRQRDEARRQVAALRAILAPFLDDPRAPRPEGACLVCVAGADQAHGPTCPVPRTDDLLGRTDRPPERPPRRTPRPRPG